MNILRIENLDCNPFIRSNIQVVALQLLQLGFLLILFSNNENSLEKISTDVLLFARITKSSRNLQEMALHQLKTAFL